MCLFLKLLLHFKGSVFQTAIQEAILAFNNVLQDFGYTQTLEHYDSTAYQAHHLIQHPLFS